jgi:hypothetical protein
MVLWLRKYVQWTRTYDGRDRLNEQHYVPKYRKERKIVQYKTKQQVVFVILNIQWWVFSPMDVMLCIYVVWCFIDSVHPRSLTSSFRFHLPTFKEIRSTPCTTFILSCFVLSLWVQFTSAHLQANSILLHTNNLRTLPHILWSIPNSSCLSWGRQPCGDRESSVPNAYVFYP